jgi:ribosomal protein L11 methylase PrmA
MHGFYLQGYLLQPIASSFRDPSGFLFIRDGQYCRMINRSYQPHYDHLMSSGLYEALINKGWLIAHQETAADDTEDSYKILTPDQLQYVSYPYEWSFSQLKDAAILTLNIALEALKHDMVLKDASAYNVQIHRGKPTFIDTLSFERYESGAPWVAYRQYCQHFLAPLALMAHRDFRTLHLLRAYIDGLPIDLASTLLPKKTWLNYGLLAHIHLHAMSQKKYEDEGRADNSNRSINVSRLRFQGLLESLLATTKKLQWKYAATEWGNYYEDTNYVDESMTHKEQAVTRFLDVCRKPGAIAADFGANTGKFSRLAAAADFFVLAHDIDEVAVDRNYRQMIALGEQNLQPLLLDLTNPSPGLGWANEERPSLLARKQIDVGLALALIHHIAISNNVPLERAAAFFQTLCRQLIIEFVPKADSQVKRLLSTREDVFPNYTQEGFEQAFSQYFTITEAVPITGTERTLYLMTRLPD